jgi:hypothetical protein
MTQKQRSLVTLATLLVIGALVGVYAWFGVYRPGKQEEAAKEKTDTLFDFKKEEVLKLSVTARGETTEAERPAPSPATDGGPAPVSEWRIVSPVHTSGDSANLDAIVEKLSGLKQKREVKAPDKLAAYGLDKPRAKVAATLVGGKSVELDLGADNTYDGTLYAHKAGDDRVSILEASVRPPLDKTTFDLRDKRLFVFEESDVKHLDVATGKNAYALERSEDGQWKLTAPQQMPADATKSGQIAGSLRGLRAVRFVTDQATQDDLVRYGLSKPAATVEMVIGHNPEQKTLVFGDVTEGGIHHVYAKRAELPYVAEVPATILKDLDQTTADLRDKTILSFDPAQVVGLRFSIGGATFEARKVAAADGGAGEAWRLVGPNEGPAKKWRLAALVTFLHDLKGSSIVSDHASDADLEKEGLKAPTRTVTVLGSGDRVLAELLIGKDDAGKTFLKAREVPRVFQLETSRLSQIPPNALDLAETPPPGDGGPSSVTAATSTPAKK